MAGAVITRTALLASSALLAGLLLTGCTPDAPSPEPGTTPTAAGPSSPGPSPSGEAVALPDCDGIYSAPLVAALTAEGRTPLGDVSGPPGTGGWPTFDPDIEAIMAGLADVVTCTWILPASESGSTTGVALLDPDARAALEAALVAGGFTASAALGGDLHELFVEGDYPYTEAHLIRGDVWIGSVYGFGDATELTTDTAGVLFP